MTDYELIELWKQAVKNLASMDLTGLSQSERNGMAYEDMRNLLQATVELGKRGYVRNDDNEWYHSSKEN